MRALTYILYTVVGWQRGERWRIPALPTNPTALWTAPVTDGMDASPLHRTGSGEFQKGVLA